MTRIQIPQTISDAPEKSQELLRGVEKQLGSVPNLYRLVATSPAAIEGLLSLNGALGKSSLTAATRERIALAVSEYNGCEYCLAAHTYIGQNLVKLTESEILANRNGHSSDAKANAAIRFALAVAQAKGNVSSDEFDAIREAGFSDAAIIEIIGLVALNVFTNYANNALLTEVDFPVVEELAI